MSFDWRPESKDRYFRKAEAAVKAAGFDDILQISKVCNYEKHGQGVFQADSERGKDPPMVGGKEKHHRDAGTVRRA